MLQKQKGAVYQAHNACVWVQALDVCIALLEPKPVAGESYAPPPGVVDADTPLSLSELDAAVKAAAVQACRPWGRSRPEHPHGVLHHLTDSWSTACSRLL